MVSHSPGTIAGLKILVPGCYDVALGTRGTAGTVGECIKRGMMAIQDAKLPVGLKQLSITSGPEHTMMEMSFSELGLLFCL